MIGGNPIEVSVGAIRLDDNKKHLLATIYLISASDISDPISVFARIADATGEVFDLKLPYCGATVNAGEPKAIPLCFSAPKAVLPSEGSRLLVTVRGRCLSEPLTKQFISQNGTWSQAS